MAAAEVDDYIAALDEPARSTLRAVREAILDVVPDAEQVIAYGAPAFRVGGSVVAGVAAFPGHLSYLPHSGTVLATLADEVAGYRTSKGALRFPLDEPLPAPLVRTLVTARLRELGAA